jgi:hypothetical protein
MLSCRRVLEGGWRVHGVSMICMHTLSFHRSQVPGLVARRLLKSLSIKQGIKYDSPESARDIHAFIDFHGLKVDEILEPIESFSAYIAFIQR